MGILERLGLRRGDKLAAAARNLGVTSPYSSARSELHPIFKSDFLTDEQKKLLPLGRDLAITVPAVSKARNLLISSLAPLPLVALESGTDARVATQPQFLHRSDTGVDPHDRMAWTLDDLVFYGCSLWLVARGERTSGARGPILDAVRVPIQDWNVNPEGEVTIYDEPATPDEYLIFNPPFEGLLNIGKRTILGAIGTEEAWTSRARNPIPAIDLHQVADDLTDEEVQEYVDAWAIARTNPNGAIGSTPPSIEIKTYGEIKTDLYLEGRNAVRTDIGSFTNIRASMLDGTTGVESLTYTTKDGERNLFFEIDLPFWTAPIESRLSLDDVVPRGQRVRFDRASFTAPPTPTGTPTED